MREFRDKKNSPSSSDKRILFWSEVNLNAKERIVELKKKSAAFGLFLETAHDALCRAGILGRDPHDYVTHEPTATMKNELAKILAHGNVGISYMGRATCRMCDRELGNADMHGYGFMWPQGAEHYILDHSVWTPECSDLLLAVTYQNIPDPEEVK